MRARPLAPALLSAALVACAGAPPPDADPAEPETPFIKLANRRVAIAARFAPGVASAGYQQAFGRALARRLETAYRTEIAVRPPAPPDAPLDALTDAEILWAVQRRVDDVVLVRVDAPKPGALAPTADIITVADLSVRHRVPLAAVRPKTPAADRPAADRLADLLSVRITRTWTDPGGAPRVRPIGVANRLAGDDRCRAAVRIYDAVLPKIGAGNFGDIRALAQAQRLHHECQQKVRVEDMMRADARARFEVTLDAQRFVPEVEAAFERAARRPDLARALRKFTDKPVTIVARPDGLFLRMRYHADRLRDRLRSPGEVPALDLAALAPVMSALVELRNDAADRVQMSRAVREIKTTVRLQRLPYSYLEIDFADLDGRLLLTNSLRVKLGKEPPMTVEARVPVERNTLRFVLGPYETDAGRPTPAAAVGRFLELR